MSFHVCDEKRYRKTQRYNSPQCEPNQRKGLRIDNPLSSRRECSKLEKVCIFCNKQDKYPKRLRSREVLHSCAQFQADERIK